MQRLLLLYTILFITSLPLLSKPLDNNTTTNQSPYTLYTYVSYTHEKNDDAYKIMLNSLQTPTNNMADLKYDKVIKDLAYLQLFALGTIGVIALLPEDVSNWSKEDKELADLQELLEKHSGHIEDGPVLDNDTWAINYIGHSVAGSYFYVWGRQSGLSWQESAMLTTLMSTFYWEYGWEAFAETPSTQDLIITPLLGSLLGEGTNYLYNVIAYNDRKLYGSVVLGSIASALLNPIGEMNSYLDRQFEAADIEVSVDYGYASQREVYSYEHTIENYSPMQSYFKFNLKFKY
jgi:hypothetical protein